MFKIIIYIVGILVLTRWIFQLLIPPLVRSAFREGRKEADYQYKKQRKQGSMHINYAPPQNGKKHNYHNISETVDYEEIK